MTVTEYLKYNDFICVNGFYFKDIDEFINNISISKNFDIVAKSLRNADIYACNEKKKEVPFFSRKRLEDYCDDYGLCLSPYIPEEFFEKIEKEIEIYLDCGYNSLDSLEVDEEFINMVILKLKELNNAK